MTKENFREIGEALRILGTTLTAFNAAINFDCYPLGNSFVPFEFMVILFMDWVYFIVKQFSFENSK